MNRRILFQSAIAAIAAVSFTPFSSRIALAGKADVFTGLIDGVGAGGYDVVAYFTKGAAVPGNPAITALQDGVTYRFENEASRDAFVASPLRFLPAYGGYCAYAVANGYTAKIDPEAFTVDGGRLFLNYSKSVRTKWAADQASNIKAGDANWPSVLEK
jgi:hypothetical protein